VRTAMRIILSVWLKNFTASEYSGKSNSGGAPFAGGGPRGCTRATTTGEIEYAHFRDIFLTNEAGRATTSLKKNWTVALSSFSETAFRKAM